jgi:uncharacterized protein (DUF1499 family)
MAMSETAASVELTDFTVLRRPDSPNTWLVAPAGLCAASADEAAPSLPVDAAVLARAWVAVVQAQPRTQIRAVSSDGLQVEAEQRSGVFGFVDRISFRAVPLAAQRSTLVAYSRSEVGYWDLGVNRSRLRAWLAALQNAVAAAES